MREIQVAVSVRLRALAGAALLALAALPGAAVAQTPPPPPAAPAAPVKPSRDLPRGDLEITVVAADGKKFKDCTVYANDKVVVFGDAGGPKLAQGLPVVLDASFAVTADARVSQGAGKPDKRYMGVTEVSPEANKTVKVKVSMKPVDDINAFCGSCHPGRGQRPRAGQIKRDVHPSGMPLQGRYLEQVGKYNAAAEALRKEKKPANEPILLDERIVKEGGKDVKRKFYTCESCHTPHWTTPHTKYARANFRDRGDLCTGCHY